MFYSEDIIEEVRQRNDIIDIISLYVKLQKRGSNYIGLCPFHNEKTPSFSVSAEKQMYHCFGCGIGGNVFTFLMEYENNTFVETVKFLAERSGVKLPEIEYSKEGKKRADQKNQLLEIQKQAAFYFYHQLKSKYGKVAYEYLTKRGLSDKTIIGFGLGYSNKTSDDLYRYLKNSGYSDNILRQSGLITIEEVKGAHDKFWNRVMFPIMDVNHHVIGFGGRVMGEGNPKYLNSPETKIFDKSRNLYGLNFAKSSRKKEIILCEGYMDVIAMHQAGFNQAVASLGTAFTGLQANLLKRYTKEVMLCYDSDDAGIKAALRALPILREAGLSVKVINMKPYKDPDELIKTLGAEEFQKRINQAKSGFYFEIEVLEKKYDLENPEQKTKFFNEVAKQLLIFEEELERNVYIEAIARDYNISFDNLKKLVNRYGTQMILETGYNLRKNEYSISHKKSEDGIIKAQKMLLTWISSDKRVFQKIEKIISPRDFKDKIANKVADMLFVQYQTEGKIIPAKIFNYFESKEEQNIASSFIQTNLEQGWTKIEQEKALNDIVKKVKKYSLEYDSYHEDNINQLQQIFREKQELDNLHISLQDG